jgi:hypothetical protein
MSFNFSPKIVTDGLVLYLDAANTKSYVSGSTTWFDISKTQTNGTIYNSPTFSPNNSGILLFDGINDYVDFGINVGNFIGDYTCEVWTYTQSIGSTFKTILVKRDNANNDFTSPIGMFISNGGGSTNLFQWKMHQNWFINYNNFFVNNEWVHITCTIEGTTMKLYRNSILLSQTTFGGVRQTNNAPFIVGYYPGFTNYWLGGIPIVRLYNKSLSQQEIIQNYNANKSRFGLT